MNLVNVMTRRAEGYHDTLRQAASRGEVVLARSEEVETIHTTRVRVKEWGLERHLVVDWYRRASFLDHFLAPGAGPAMIARGQARELGDFVDQPFQVTVQRAPWEVAVQLVRDGHVWVGDVHAPVRVEKRLVAQSGGRGVEVTCRVTNQGEITVATDFAVETNWGTTGPDAAVVAGGFAARVGDHRRVDRVDAVTICDPGWGLEVEMAMPPGSLWVVPIEVVSASEAGFERTFQGVSLFSVWPVRLNTGEVWEGRLAFAWRITAAPETSDAATPDPSTPDPVISPEEPVDPV